jgi:hypothetical protein
MARASALLLAAALLAAAAAAAAPALRGGRSQEPPGGPAPRCAAFELAREGGGAALLLRVRCGARLREWAMAPAGALYAAALERAGAHGGASYKSVRPGDGWAVAHVAADGALHGTWYDAEEGITHEFVSAERQAAPATDTRGLSEMAPAVVVSESLLPSGCAQAPPVAGLALAVQAAARAGAAALKQQHVSSSRPSGAADPLMFWGRGTCYPDDSYTHTLSVGVLLHSSFLRYYGSSSAARAAMEAALVTSSVVYEYQFNVALQIGTVMDATSAPLVAAELLTSCPGSSVVDALGAMSPVVAGLAETQGVWTLLTNCYPASKTGTGILGVANMGASGCGFQARGWNIGVVNTSPGLWRTLAHELGHGLGMQHSFENGVGATGGIMDYGNPLVDGVPRFRVERAPEACATLAAMKAARCSMLVNLERRVAPRPTLPFPSARPTRPTLPFPSARPTRPGPPSVPASSPTSSLAPSAPTPSGGAGSGSSSGAGPTPAPTQPGPALSVIILAAGLSAVFLVTVAGAAVRFSRRDIDRDGISSRSDIDKGRGALAPAPAAGRSP